MSETDQNELNYQDVLESMTESILITATNLDHPGPTITYVNQAFEKMTGWSRAEIIGQSPRVLQGPETDLSIFQGMTATLEAGKVWRGRTINYRRDGNPFYMDWSIAPMRSSEGKIYQYLAVQKEVTEIVFTERKLQEAKELEVARLIEIQKTNQRLNRMVTKQQETLSLFTKYVPEPIIRKALEEGQEEGRRGEELEVALLFCDIRGFTGMAEKLNPDQVVLLLNTYYSFMADTIGEFGGVINEFVGDEIFVSFGAPLPIQDPELSAARCGSAMIETLARINEVTMVEIGCEIVVGIGIHYGAVIVGNLGSKDRLTYSITGSPVIIAKRIESLTRGLKNAVLISEQVFGKVSSHFNSKPLGMVDIDGQDRQIGVHQILNKNV